VIFQKAAEHPQPGEPGKEVGDLFIERNVDKTVSVIISLGSKTKNGSDSYRKAGGSLGRWLVKNNVREANLNLAKSAPQDDLEMLVPLCEGVLLGAYQFLGYKSDLTPQPTLDFYISSNRHADMIEKIINKTEILISSVNLARDWAHEPGNSINPVTLAERVQTMAHQLNLKCIILDETALQTMGAGAIVAVGKGSKTPSRLIIVEYPGHNPQPDAKPVILIGKALTMDTGGYSIKDRDNIQGMKYDKCGGMIVVASIHAAALLKIKTPVVGIIPAAENMISDDAYRPDDIIKSLSGKTIEIVSTDAEGRLVLADALTYAQRCYEPRSIIDMATLTGGVVTALGRLRAGLMSNNHELTRQIVEAGEKTKELVWELPLDDDYFQQIKGDDADIKNSGGKEAHPIIGGTFLKQFVDEKIPWAHIDIAGVADTPKETHYSPKGATGYGVRLMINYLENL
jgi:leucyl aminopeptidase